MKSSLLLMLLIFTTGCIENSNNNSNPKDTYSLSPYKGNILDPTEFSGTWVSVTTLISDKTVDSDTFNLTVSQLKFFIIRSTESGYEAADCRGGFEDLSSDNSYNEDLITTSAENIITHAENTEVETENGIEYRAGSVQLIRISDNTSPIGSLQLLTSLHHSELQKNLYCYSISKATAFKNESIFKNFDIIIAGSDDASYFNYDSQTGATPNTEFEILIKNYIYDEYYEYDDETGTENIIRLYEDFDYFSDTYYEEDSVSLVFDQQDDFTQHLTFNSSGWDGDITGSIQIQLPTQ